MHRSNLSRRAMGLAAGTALALLTAALVPAGPAQEAQTRPGADPKINAQFKKANVKSFLTRFESDERETYAHRKEVVKALGLKKGNRVADVGAGTGFYTRLFAEAVGPEGKVLAVDVSSEFLEHIKATARAQGLSQISVIRGGQDSTNLPHNSLDLVFLSDVYHHFEKPDLILGSIHRALVPGGRLVVIDFDRVEGKSPEFVLKHVRASQKVFKSEIESAGFKAMDVDNPPKFKQNFFLMFRRLDEKPQPAKRSK